MNVGKNIPLHPLQRGNGTAPLFIVTMLRTLAVACGLVFVGAVAAAAAEDAPPLPKSAQPNEVYCGLNTVYTVLRLTGSDVPFSSLIKPEYLGSQQGSTLSELRRAAEDHGLNALPVASLTADVLRESPYPMILHVKSQIASEKADHFELCLGVRDGKAVLYDPPGDVRLEPLHRLLPRWEGAGLVVSKAPIESELLFWPARKRQFYYIAGIVALIGILRWGKKRMGDRVQRLRLSRQLAVAAAQGGAFVVAAVLCSLLAHFVSDTGFLAHAETSAAVQQANLDGFLVEVDANETKQLVTEGAVVIDARWHADFDRGHIANAINIEPNASLEVCKQRMASIDTLKPIVVYCQSAGCPYAERVARILLSAGYENLNHYRGGWNDWKTNAAPSASRKGS